jgi:hypothetical protein
VKNPWKRKQPAVAVWAPKIDFEIKQGFGVSKIKGFKYFETGID